MQPPSLDDISPARIAAELAVLRRAIARLQAREAALLQIRDPRPGWPMQRLQTMGSMISTSAPARTAV